MNSPSLITLLLLSAVSICAPAPLHLAVTGFPCLPDRSKDADLGVALGDELAERLSRDRSGFAIADRLQLNTVLAARPDAGSVVDPGPQGETVLREASDGAALRGLQAVIVGS
jgi:hypothetical protein